MFSFLGYFNQEDKALDLTELRKYIYKKCGNHSGFFFIKNFKTPLDIGKYRLALLLENTICQKTKAVEHIDYLDVRKCIYIAYKLNEFLEHPGRYKSNKEQIPFKRDGSMEKLIEAAEAMQFELKHPEETKLGLKSEIKMRPGEISIQGIIETDEAVSIYAEVEMLRLYQEFKEKFGEDKLPSDLPETLKTGSWGYCGSTLHSAIYNLYHRLPEAEVDIPIVIRPS